MVQFPAGRSRGNAGNMQKCVSLRFCDVAGPASAPGPASHGETAGFGKTPHSAELGRPAGQADTNDEKPTEMMIMILLWRLLVGVAICDAIRDPAINLSTDPCMIP